MQVPDDVETAARAMLSAEFTAIDLAERSMLGTIAGDLGRTEVAMVAEIMEMEAMAPATLKEAQERPDWPRWEEAIQNEIGQLVQHKVWDVVDPPRNVNVVGCRWVFAIKKDTAGRIEQYKARLVAQGFSQVQ